MQKPIRSTIKAIDDLPLLNPARWPRREAVARVAALLVVSGYFLLKVSLFDPLPYSFTTAKAYFTLQNHHYGIQIFGLSEIKMLWLLRMGIWVAENAILVGYLAAYLTRLEAVGVAKGFGQVVFPFLVAVLPMVMALAPVNFSRTLPVQSGLYVVCYAAVLGLILLGALINLIGLLTMRRAFAIMSEARTLVTRGIFRYLRHPLYAGHFVMFFGSLCLRLSACTVILYVCFVLGQIIRARIEEKKLGESFAEYAIYKQQTGMFFPRLFGRLSPK
jgi:protein-S-isoprenylcysteine O-methyltransferase Ste14